MPLLLALDRRAARGLENMAVSCCNCAACRAAAWGLSVLDIAGELAAVEEFIVFRWVECTIRMFSLNTTQAKEQSVRDRTLTDATLHPLTCPYALVARTRGEENSRNGSKRPAVQ